MVAIHRRGFKKVCGRHVVQQEFTPPDTSKMNGIAERGLNLAFEAAQVTILEAPRLFSVIPILASIHLWAEACFWAGNTLNRTATTANPDQNMPCELFHEARLPFTLLPFLKAGYCRVRRDDKGAPKAGLCLFLNWGSNHSRGSSKISFSTSQVLNTCDLIWTRVSPSRRWSGMGR